MQFSSSSIVAGEVIVGYRSPGLIPLRENLRFLEKLKHHVEVLLLQIGHGQEVAHLADDLARAPYFFAVAAEEVLPEN